ncbi:MAG: CotH kinase family protein, partial [Chitinophagales bacterium]
VPEGFWIKDSKWIIRLFEDPDFVAKVKERFHYFNTNRNFLFDGIDENAKYLNFAQAENDSTWQTLGVYVWPNNEVFDTYDEEVEYLKQWIEQRFDWLEVAIGGL